VASNAVGIGVLLRSECNFRNPAPKRRKRWAEPATGHLPREDAGARLSRRQRGDEAAKRRLRGCAVTILDVSKPFAPSRGTIRSMDSIAPITIPENLDAGADLQQAAGAKDSTSPLVQSGKCVHFEHAGQRADGREVRQTKLNPPATAMSSYRLLVCIATLGWSERDLARRTGRRQTTIVRWVKGRSPVPGEVAAWLETLAAFHMAHPAPWVEQVQETARQS